MMISRSMVMRVFGYLVTVGVVTVWHGMVEAATLESDSVGNWLLNAYSSDKTGGFQSCSMKTAGNDQVFLTVSADPRNHWFLWLFRTKWDMGTDTKFIATLNFDQDRRTPIALEAKLASERFVSLSLSAPRDRRVLDLMLKATKLRVSRESHAYTFDLAGYEKAVGWVKGCIARHNALEADKPDASIKGETDDDTSAGKMRSAKPPEMPKPAPALPSDVIEVKAFQSAKPVTALGVEQQPSPTPAPSFPLPTRSAAQQSAALQVAALPSGTSVPSSTSESAELPTSRRLEPTAAADRARRLLPDLMAAADRQDFRLLDVASAQTPLTRADAAFELTGARGVVLSVDLPTAHAAANQALAYDRIACPGTYTATTDPVLDPKTDIVRATSECRTETIVIFAQYFTVARQSGGYFVVGLTSETGIDTAQATSGKLAEACHRLVDAAPKVSGRF